MVAVVGKRYPPMEHIWEELIRRVSDARVDDIY